MPHSPEHINRAGQAGARGYLLKESANNELIEAISRVNAGERYLSRKVSAQLVDYSLRSTPIGTFIAPTPVANSV